jgi:hypothetical protein
MAAPATRWRQMWWRLVRQLRALSVPWLGLGLGLGLGLRLRLELGLGLWLVLVQG